jgi:hypothetical protein
MEGRGTAKRAPVFLVDGWPTPGPDTCEECGHTIRPELGRALARFGLDADAAPLLRTGRVMEGER